ncbi:MAG TPA: helicase-related protein [Smithellaceae bacterium]|nr:helicase-related protein [Smithellaceae bacterium]
MNLKITLTSNIRFDMSALPDVFVADLKEALIIHNPAYINVLRYARGGGRFDVAQFLFCIWQDGNDFVMPRGFARQLFNLCHKHRIVFEVEDRSSSCQETDFTFSGSLYGYQHDALVNLEKRRFGILAGPIGCGKRVTALALITKHKRPALIIVKTRRELYLWKETIKRFLGLDEKEIGQIGDGVRRIGKITVTIIDSLYRAWDEIKTSFGFLIIDCAETTNLNVYRKIVLSYDGYYMLGLCNQRERADGLTNLMTAYLGDVLHEIKLPGKFAALGALRPKLIVQTTAFAYLYREDFKEMITALCRDEQRNALIITDLLHECSKSSVRVLALSDRVEHLKSIKEAIAQAHGLDAAVITGETSEKDRQTILEQFQRNKGLLLMTFRSLSAIELPGINRLFVLTPMKNGDYISHAAGALIAGNTSNDEPGAIYDYRDIQVSVLDSSYQKRRKLYGSMGVIRSNT